MTIKHQVYLDDNNTNSATTSLLITDIIFEKQEELDSYAISLKGLPTQYSTEDIEEEADFESKSLDIQEKLFNVIVTLFLLMALFEGALYVVLWSDANITSFGSEEVMFFFFDIFIPIIARLTNLHFTTMFLLRLFIVRKVFGDHTKASNGVARLQFNHLIVRVIGIWIGLLLNKVIVKQLSDMSIEYFDHEKIYQNLDGAIQVIYSGTKYIDYFVVLSFFALLL